MLNFVDTFEQFIYSDGYSSLVNVQCANNYFLKKSFNCTHKFFIYFIYFPLLKKSHYYVEFSCMISMFIHIFLLFKNNNNNINFFTKCG